MIFGFCLTNRLSLSLYQTNILLCFVEFIIGCNANVPIQQNRPAGDQWASFTPPGVLDFF